MQCVYSCCEGYNEKRNIFNAGRHFITFLLPHGAPSKLKLLIDWVVDGYANVTLNTEQLLRLMDKIVEIYSKGSYLDRNGRRGEGM